MLTDKSKKQILQTLLEIIEGISDKEYQRRVWIRGEGPECDDFTETTCFFYDFGNSVLKEHKEFWITDIQYTLLKKLTDAFNVFPYRFDLPEEFIDTPEWTRITEMAKEVLRAFNYKKV